MKCLINKVGLKISLYEKLISRSTVVKELSDNG